jgi:hypothetical protein
MSLIPYTFLITLSLPLAPFTALEKGGEAGMTPPLSQTRLAEPETHTG